MSQSRAFSDRHRRTRNDHAQETAEDYVEAIDEILLLMSWFRVHPEALNRTTTLEEWRD